MDIRKVDAADAATQCDEQLCSPEAIGALQVAIYTMIGGGMIGNFATRQPADFYIDTRVGRLPYPTKAIYQAVAVLAELAKRAGLDPHNMPTMPRFHASGIF